MSAAPLTLTPSTLSDDHPRARAAALMARASSRGDHATWGRALSALISAEQERLEAPVGLEGFGALADAFAREGLGAWMEVARPARGSRRGSLLDVDEVSGYLEGGAPARASDAGGAGRVLALAELVAVATTRFEGAPDLPITAMVGDFGLDALEVAIVALLWRAQVDPFFSRACQVAQNDLTARPDVPLIAGCLFGAPGPMWAQARARLHPEGTLCRSGLVLRRGAGPGAQVELATSVASALDGWPMLGDDLGGLATWRRAQGACEGPVETFDADLAERLAARGGRHLAVVGPAHLQRERRVERAAALAELGTLTVKTSDLAARGSGDLEATLAAAARDARLLSATLHLACDEAPGEGRRVDLRRVRAALDRVGASAVVSVDAWAGEAVGAFGDAVVMRLPAASVAQRERAWRVALEGAGLASLAGASEALSRRAPLPPTHMEAVAAEVAMQSSPDERALTAAATRKLAERPGHLTEVVTTSLRWSDVVLPEETLERLMEIISFARYRDEVFEGWGFGRKVPYGRALTAMFHGAPGTGKTMVASLIARELGKVLLRVNLAEVSSKWIGETEKNLARVFEEARRHDAVLLFDEADSLFGKRVKADSANARYANMNVNFLLQAIEAHEGVVLLTTNLQSAIDEAFARRIRFKVRFDLPGPAERQALFASMFPPEARVADDVDLEALASTFELSGGYIKEVALRAAFSAAERGAAIDHAALHEAACRIYAELGRIAPR